MEAELCNEVPSQAQVKATFRLGSESYCVQASKGSCLSEQLALMKEESMIILKDFITKHNVAQDVPDELVEEASSEDDTAKPQAKSKKTKLK